MTSDKLRRLFTGSLMHVGYAVKDIPTAVEAWAKLGVGPFMVMEHAAFDVVEGGGEAGSIDYSGAFAWWGEVGLELQQVTSLQPASAARSLKVGQGPVLNHIGYQSRTPAQDSARLQQLGMPQFLYTRMGEVHEWWHYAPALGHAIQIHPDNDTLNGFWKSIREASETWDGSEPLRQFVNAG